MADSSFVAGEVQDEPRALLEPENKDTENLMELWQKDTRASFKGPHCTNLKFWVSKK